MTQLVYHPAFDPYNALLRIVRVLLLAPSGMEKAGVRIAEFFLLFPERLVEARLTTQLKARVKTAAFASRFPYDRLPSSKILFERMEPSFDAALQTLLARGLAVESPDSTLTLDVTRVPQEILDLALEHNKNDAQISKVFGEIFESCSISGPNGLKDRSKLMEHRYDVV